MTAPRRNRVEEAIARGDIPGVNPSTPKTIEDPQALLDIRKHNIPMHSGQPGEIPTTVFLENWDEYHQHDEFPHLVLLVKDERRERHILCLFCGRHADGMKADPETGLREQDNQGMFLFKGFHRECLPPKDPIALFNAEAGE